MSKKQIAEFIERWSRSAASERANYQLFLIALCDVLNLPCPNPATSEADQDTYVLERPIRFRNPDGTTSPGFIDLYQGARFVLETKQGCEQKRSKTLLENAGLHSPRRRRGHEVRGT